MDTTATESLVDLLDEDELDILLLNQLLQDAHANRRRTTTIVPPSLSYSSSNNNVGVEAFQYELEIPTSIKNIFITNSERGMDVLADAIYNENEGAQQLQDATTTTAPTTTTARSQSHLELDHHCDWKLHKQKPRRREEVRLWSLILRGCFVLANGNDDDDETNNNIDTSLQLFCKEILSYAPPTTRRPLPPSRFYKTNNNTNYSHIQQLDLGNNQLNDMHAIWLASGLTGGSCSKLKTLILDRNRIGDMGVCAIANSFRQQNDLEVLNLASNKTIGPQGCRALAISFGGECGENHGHQQKRCRVSNSSSGEGSNLKVLDLSDNRVGDAGAIILAELFLTSRNTNNSQSSSSRLEVLKLKCNGIRNRGAQAIARALSRNNTIHTIDLSMNFGISNSRVIDEFENALTRHQNYSLTSLKLWMTTLCYINAANSNGGGNGEEEEQPSLSRLDYLKQLCCKNNQTMVHYNKLIETILKTDRAGDFRGNYNNKTRTPTPLLIGIWDNCIELVNDKPDLIYRLIKMKPEYLM